MEKFRLDDMIKGWFIGNFEPSLIKTTQVEVAIKKYKKGDCEECHYHKIATEITVITAGSVVMNKQTYIAGDIIVIHPNESADFEALEDTVTTVVKYPGANNDKYIINEAE